MIRVSQVRVLPPLLEHPFSSYLDRAKMATESRVAITLACTECKRRNYQTQKSKRNSPDRVEFRVLPLVRHAHVHRETR